MNKTLEKILIITSDFIAINLAWIAYFYFRVESGWFQLITEPVFIAPMLVVYFYWLMVFLFIGMYRTWFALSRFDELTSLFKATFVGIFLLFFLIFIDDFSHGVSSANRFLILVYWGFFLLFVGSGRLFVRSFQRNLLIKGIGRKSAIIVGFNEKGRKIHDEIENHKALGLDIAGYAAVKDENLGKEHNGKKVLGSATELDRLIDKYNLNEIIISLPTNRHELLLDIIAKCDSKNVGIKIVPDLYELLSGQARTMQIYGFPLIDIMPQLMPEWEKKIKRLLDILVSFIIGLITLPMTILTAIAIKLDSKGPILFTQERCGLNGEVFKVYKFRSMREDAEKLSGPVWSSKDDPRVTKVGKFIRKVRIDELPQMINVLKGK